MSAGFYGCIMPRLEVVHRIVQTICSHCSNHRLLVVMVTNRCEAKMNPKRIEDKHPKWGVKTDLHDVVD